MDIRCKKHGGGDLDLETKMNLAPLMDSLPEYQAEPGRHKCPLCAFYHGYSKGIEAERHRIAESLELEIDELEPAG